MWNLTKRTGFVVLLLAGVAACATDGSSPTAPRIADVRADSQYSTAIEPGAARLLAAPGPLSVATPRSQAPSLLLNGSFEANGGLGTSAFEHWAVDTLPWFGQWYGNWYVQAGTATPPGGGSEYSVPAPTDAMFAAMTNTTGPGARILYQDVFVPLGGALLTFDVFIGNRAAAFATPPTLNPEQQDNQQLRVDIVNPALPIDDVAGVLRMVYRTEVGDPLVSGYTTVTSDLSAFQNQLVRLRFGESDNLNFLQVGIDNAAIYRATQRAKGSGQVTFAKTLYAFTISQIKRFTNGTVNGSWSLTPAQGTGVQFKAKCAEGPASSRETAIGGVVARDPSGTYPVGTPAVFKLRDNTVGIASADQLSRTRLFPGGDITAICRNLPKYTNLLPWQPVSAGDIDVRVFY